MLYTYGLPTTSMHTNNIKCYFVTYICKNEKSDLVVFVLFDAESLEVEEAVM